MSENKKTLSCIRDDSEKVAESVKINKDIMCNLEEKKSIFGRLNGKTANIVIRIYSSFLGQYILSEVLKKKINLSELLSYQIHDEPCNGTTEYSLDIFDEKIFDRPELSSLETLFNIEKNKDYLNPYLTIEDYHKAYKLGVITPLQVAQTLLDLLESNEQIKSILNAVTEFNKDEILKMASESTERYKNNSVISIVDGVPFFSKEDIPKKGYTMTCGTSFPMTPSETTAVIIDRLTDAGAIFMGITRMTMLGYGTIGSNPASGRGPVRNPYNINHYCGGSSTGSAAVVAAGLCPFSIGVDGVGSNRIPPATTGMNGLKATYARIPLTNFQNPRSTNAVPGPIAASVQDIAIVYGIIAGPCKGFLTGLHQPQVELPKFTIDIEKLKSIKFGIDAKYTEMAKESSVVNCVFDFVKRLENLGVTVQQYTLDECWQTIVACQCQFIYEKSRDNCEIYGSKNMESMECCNASFIYQTGLYLKEKEYLQCKRQRARSIKLVQEMFSEIDIFITPTIGSLAPVIQPTDEICGVLDDTLVSRLTRYAALASFTGIPAISLFAGFEETKKLPLAIQLQASWWKEKDLLETAYLIEQLLYPGHRTNENKPQIFELPMQK